MTQQLSEQPHAREAARNAERIDDKVIRVSAGAPTDTLASAIAHAIYEGRQVVLRCIGAAAVNQAQKAVAKANGFTAPRGYILSTRPAFVALQGSKGDDVHGMAFAVLVDR